MSVFKPAKIYNSSEKRMGTQHYAREINIYPNNYNNMINLKKDTY